MAETQLAILGASPAFKKVIHVGRPNIANSGRFIERTHQILERRWLSNNGPVVREFEQSVSAFLGVKHCICVCNATIGLEIAIRAAGLSGEVIVPSFTFVATAHALQWQEITPVFADIDPQSHNIDPAQIERHITAKTTGILATHVWGRPCAIEPLVRLSEKHGIKLLFDAAHAFGCSYQGQKLGGFGLAEVFSFHATKFVNSFEGGAITTNDGELAAKVRLMVNFGFSGFDNVIHLGTNGKMTEVSAAMGLTNLEGIEHLLDVNSINYEIYREELGGVPGISVLDLPPKDSCNRQYIVVEVESDSAGLNRNQIVEVLHAENVLARKYFWPGCHRMEPYRTLYPDAHLLLPKTDLVASRVLILPTGTGVSPQEIGIICRIIRFALQKAKEVRLAVGRRSNQEP